MDIDSLILKARQQFDNVKPVDQDVLLGDEVVTVRFWPMSGPDWRNHTARFPMRDGVAFDQTLGYDIDSAVREYPKVYLVQGDDVVPVAGKFASICDVLTAPELNALALAVWGLNEYDPAQRLASAGKASKGGSRKKRSSPVSSE